MFTGIIEALGEIKEVFTSGNNRSFWLQSVLTAELKVDQSVSHNGVCLTVEAVEGDAYKVTAVQETLDKTTLGRLAIGDSINLERSLLPTSRLDGHFVQGHVDVTGICQAIEDKEGSFEITFGFPPAFAELMIEKGSIAVNGISLTAFAVGIDSFKVAVIPFTWEHTNLQFLKEGDGVNLEFDMLGKYILRKMSLS